MNIFFYLIINFFLKLAIAGIINMERINRAIKNSILHLEDTPIKNDTIVFKYEKYQIICYNFRLMNPDLENISINNSSSIIDSNYNIYYLENITFLLIFDLKINHYSDFEIEETDNFLEINCPKIIYKYDIKNDFLSFESINISESITFNLNSDKGIDSLNYYKDAKEKKKCLCKFGSENNTIEEFPEIYMIRFLKYLFSYYFSEMEFNDILLTYDIKEIFSNALITIDNFNKNIFEYVKFNKILIPFDKMETLIHNNKRAILIHQINFFGLFNLTEFKKEYEFNFQLNEEKNQKIELFNRSINFNFNDIIINTNYEGPNKSEIIETIKSFIINDFSNALINSNKKYYSF